MGTSSVIAAGDRDLSRWLMIGIPAAVLAGGTALALVDARLGFVAVAVALGWAQLASP